MTTPPRSFAEFWPYYVSQHADARCRAWHFVGTSLAFATIAVAGFFREPLWLVAAPIVGYGFAWIGHFGFEKNRPASWHSAQHLVWSFRGDMKMWWCTLRGKMADEVRAHSDAPNPS